MMRSLTRLLIISLRPCLRKKGVCLLFFRRRSGRGLAWSLAFFLCWKNWGEGGKRKCFFWEWRFVLETVVRRCGL